MLSSFNRFEAAYAWRKSEITSAMSAMDVKKRVCDVVAHAT